MIEFALNEEALEIIFVPIQLNIIFNNIEHCQKYEQLENLADNLFTEDWADILIEDINQDVEKQYVIDLRGIKGTEKVFEKLLQLTGVKILFVNYEDIISCHIKGVYKDKIHNLSESFLGTQEGVDAIRKTYKDINEFVKLVSRYFQNECANRLDRFGTRKEVTRNFSSNIFTTMYIDIRKLFVEENNIAIFLYGLFEIIKKIGDFDSFVVVSSNGAILANILSYIFRKNVLYLMNLGPKIALKDKEIRTKIGKGVKYVYIYDFMCLGNELKMLDTLLKIHGAMLKNSVGIAQLLKSDRYDYNKNMVQSVVNLENYPSTFKYEIACYEEELRKDEEK